MNKEQLKKELIKYSLWIHKLANESDTDKCYKLVEMYLGEIKEPKRCSLCGGTGKIVKGGSFGGSTEIEQCSCKKLRFPTNEKELKEFDEMFKDYPHNLKGDEIDPNKIIEESLKEIKEHENKHCKKCGRLKSKRQIYPGYIGKVCDCGLI